MAAQGTAEQQGALDIVKTFLDRYGLGGMADWAWQEIVNGASTSKVQLDLYDRPEFKQRFPAIEERRQKGLAPISPDEYISYERQAGQMMRAAGFPPSFYDQPEDFHKLIGQDVSVQELSQRTALYQTAAYQVPQETRDTLKTLYGVDEGHLAAYFADPDRAMPLIQQRFQASQISGNAQVQGFGALNQTEAERLAALGVTPEQSMQGFGTVVQAAELFKQLPGETTMGPGRDEALGLVAGNAQAQQAVQTQAAKRKAQFASGGGYAATNAGTTGLGSANS